MISQRLIAEVGAAAAELGVEETDDRPLTDIATTLADLLGDPPRRQR